MVRGLYGHKLRWIVSRVWQFCAHFDPVSFTFDHDRVRERLCVEQLEIQRV